MNKLTALCVSSLMAIGAAAAEQPAITIKTDIYNQFGSANHFTLLLGSTEQDYYDVDCGFGEVEYLVKPAQWDAENYSISGTPIDCTVSAEGTIKIYGDPSKLNYIYAEGACLRYVEMGQCVNMEIVNLPHNELQALDLSGFPKLAAVYLSDNPFTPSSPLVVGNNHPELQILEVDIIDYMDPAFDINTFAQLRSFDAYANKSLTHLDPTGCPELLRICVDSAPISSLDVTKNPKLMILNIEDTKITSIDVSANPYLRELYANHTSGVLNAGYKINEIDLTKNPNLLRLTLSGNNLTKLDVSNNPLLEYFMVNNNHLTELNVDAQKQLWEFNISNNDMSFATLPLPQTWYGNYVYNQRPVQMKKSYKVGDEIDLSHLVLREGSVTTPYLIKYNAKTDASTALDASAYSYADGKLKFLTEVSDSVYVRFTNTIFDEYPMTTTRFMVKSEANYGKPSKILSFNIDGSVGDEYMLSIGLRGASAATPKEFFIDWGDGNLVSYQCTGSQAKSYKKMAYGVASIYIPEDEVLTAFGVRDKTLYSVALTGATELETLTLAGTGLYSIDLSMNRCLQSLNLEGNNLYSLDLRGANGAYNKNVLTDVNISNNSLSELKLTDPRSFVHFNADNNKFTSFSLQEYSNIKTFSMAGNELSELNLAYLEGATSIDISNNKIATLTLPEMPELEYFNLSGNSFSLGDLPYFSNPDLTYVYAPQAQVQLPNKAPGVNLANQCRSIDGSNTEFAWLKEDGTPLAAADYVCNEGATRFLNEELGKVYCVMTNSAFPQFAGDKALRTSLVEVVGMPTNCIANFTTTKTQSVDLSLAAADAAGTALYIDWNGDGTALEQYPLTDTYTRFQATTKAGANAKVYTYSADEKITVFSISGAAMSNMDASGLTSCSTLTVAGAGLSEITLPQSAPLRELNLEGNQLSDFDFTMYPNLFYLILNKNQLTELDLTKYPKMQIFSAAENNIEKVALNNPLLWQLDLSHNQLSTVDMSKTPDMQNLALSYNKLSAIDLSACNNLRALQLDHNNFTFATLPPVRSDYGLYLYRYQNPITAECVDGKVDISSQAKVGSTATEYRWYVGAPTLNDDGELEGEELYVDDEYSVENGVSTFYTSLDNLVCVMTNAEFPGLYLYTMPLSVVSGVKAVSADNYKVVAAPGELTIYGADAPITLYSIDGRKAGQTHISAGQAKITSLQSGIYVLTIGNCTYKVRVP